MAHPLQSLMNIVPLLHGLNVVPVEEFRKWPGQISFLYRGSSLSFTMEGETFTVNAGARIAPGQAPFNLYVLHDPNWKPSYPNADLDAFNMGATDRAESLLSK